MQARHPTILVVEDDEDIRRLMQQIMQKLGYKVITAADGAEAMAHIEQQSLDIVLLDVMMPVIDGFEVLGRIRERFSMVDLPVIMVTSLSEDDYVVRALKMGANDYVSKPFDFNVIQARVNTQLTLKRLSAQNKEFLEITSHDLRKNVALITDVISDMDEQLQGLELGDGFKSACALIKASSDSMKRITEDFLELQVVQDGNILLFKCPFDMNELIKKVIDQERIYADRKGVMLTSTLLASPVMVNADMTRIEQVLVNLVGNAIKFSQPGTTTCVHTINRGREILVEVSDEGPGFLPEEINSVFQQQGTLSNRPTGDEVSTGMGLMICERFIRLHEGQIGVVNNSTPGATFWFSLPLAGKSG